jgi:hypothetical protein
MKWYGFALAVLGAAMLYGGIGWNRQVTMLDLGGVKATSTEHESIPFAPLAGGIVLSAGLVLLMLPRTRRAS